MRRLAIAASLVTVCTATCMLAQTGQTDKSSGASDEATKRSAGQAAEEGIPVTDPLVISRCGTCHTRDKKGNLARISWERTTPEGWEEAIKRMVRLNGLRITPEEARSIVKYLATSHGLAPDEAKPVMYMTEHRIQDEVNIPNDTVRGACTTCHPMGRALSWRRSKDDWRLLENLHVALYAQADAHFRRAPSSENGAATEPPAADPQGRRQEQPEPGEAALTFLGQAAPLHTAEWSAWQSRMRAPRIAGRWLVSATRVAHGRYVGEMSIEAGPAEDEFRTNVTLRSLKDDSTVTRSGTATVYAGYSWRGRSKGQAAAKSPDDSASDARETLWISPDQTFAEGRWFWGDYQEFGFDVRLVRAGRNPVLLSVSSYGLQTGTKGQKLHIFGDNFAGKVSPADLDPGAGIKVNSVTARGSNELIADVDVAADAVSGKRDIALAGAVLQNAFAVYRSVDYIAVTPTTALARLGSTEHPKGYQQFEAVAFENGQDGKPHTADDVELGPIDADWSVEEFLAVYGDDDKSFVGNLSETALFTPASDGPNPERKFSRNNYGDVWVVAKTKNQKDKDGKPLTGRAYLVVTVPTYIKWDQPEVSK